MEEECPPDPQVPLENNPKSPNQPSVSPPGSPSDRLSPDARCAICLGKFEKKSFTDTCLHQFCFQCLLQWSKVKPECPLCKQAFKSIIHNVRSNSDYDQYHIERREPPTYVLSAELLHSYDFDLVVPLDRTFRYRPAVTSEYFRELAESFLNRSRSPYEMPDFLSSPTYHMPSGNDNSPIQESRFPVGSIEFRRSVYEDDMWVLDLVDISRRYRECSPQFYRENPAQIHRLIPWLNREITSLLAENHSYNAYVLNRITSLLTQYSIRSQQFRQVVQPYFGSRTDHFVHEFYTFARSVYDVSGFDQHAIYVNNPFGRDVQEVMSSTGEDSDVEVISTSQQKNTSKPPSSRRNSRNAADSSPSEPVPGPSGISNGRSTETIEVGESDPDEVKVLNYTKPAPEVVTLSSDDESAAKHAKDSEHSQDGGQSSSNAHASTTRGRQRGTAVDSAKKKGSRRRSSSSSTTDDDGIIWRRRPKKKGPKFRCKSHPIVTGTPTPPYANYHTLLCPECETSSSEYDMIIKPPKKKTKGHNKKSKKSDVSKVKRKKSDTKKESKKKSKVKSCVVVPSSSGRRSKRCSGEGSARRTRRREHSYSGTDDETQSSLPSYWSIALSDKG